MLEAGDWGSAWGVVALALAVLVIPGAGMARATGLRGMAVIVASPLFTTSAAALGGILLQLIGVPWSWFSFVVFCAILVLIFATIRVTLRRGFGQSVPQKSYLSELRQGLIALVVVVVLSGLVLMTLMSGPNLVAQGWDMVFHYNATWHIVETGNASSIWGGSIQVSTNTPVFYPIAWHAIAAIVVGISGATLPVAVSSMVFAMCVVPWGAGVIYLAQTLGAKGIARTCAAGVVAMGLSAFPLIPISYGILYPFGFALSLLPGVLSLMMQLSNTQASVAQFRPGVLVALIFSAPGIALSHPSVALVLWAVAIPYLMDWTVRIIIRCRRRTAQVWQLLVVGGTTLVAIGFFPLGWSTIRPMTVGSAGRCSWNTCQGFGEGLWQWLTQSQMYGWMLPIVSILILWGCWVAIRRHLYWFILVWLVSGSAFLINTSGIDALWRAEVTGVFYQDTYRTATILAVLSIPLLLLGTDDVFRRISTVIDQWVGFRSGVFHDAVVVGEKSSGLPANILMVASVALFAVVVQLGVQPYAVRWSANYQPSRWANVLSADERMVLDKLPKYVPVNDGIIGNPATGAALAYSIGKRNVIPLYMAYDRTPEMLLLRDHLNDRSMRNNVCRTLKQFNIKYVLDFGNQTVAGVGSKFVGLRHLDLPRFKPVLQIGQSRLVKIQFCDQTP